MRDLPPTYLFGNDRRYWQRDAFQDTVVPVILFTGGEAERWNSILAEDERFVAVHDGGPDAAHVLIGNTFPTDSTIQSVLDVLNAP